MQKILIAEKNRLLREMLMKAVGADAELEIINPSGIYDHLLEDVEFEDIDWLVISTSNGEKLPLAIKKILIDFPEVAILEVAPDGNPQRIKWLEFHEYLLEDISLVDLVQILADDPKLLEEKIEKE